VVAQWLRDKKTLPPRQPNTPRIKGVDGNPGMLQSA
jgi:hypothetical protein